MSARTRRANGRNRRARRDRLSPAVSSPLSRSAPRPAMPSRPSGTRRRSGISEEQVEEGAVDLGQGDEIGEIDPLIGLVHGPPDEAEFGDRAISMEKARIRSAAGGAELGHPAGDAADRLGERIADDAGPNQKRLAADRNIERILRAGCAESLGEPML